MTQKDKQLVIKDLCARLPYEVKINIIIEYPGMGTYDNYNDILKSIDIPDYAINGQSFVDDVKPYLFPISSMTEEQKKKYFDICRSNWIEAMSEDVGTMNVLFKGVDWLNAHHFDYRGLIDKGLAIDATNLNIY